MKSIPWSVVTLILGILGSLVFLVWDKRVDPEVLVSLVSALTGGGLLHLGRVGVSSTSAPTSQ